MKTLFLTIAVIMIFQSSILIASAQDLKLVVGTITAQPGEIVELPITLVSTGQAAMVQFDLSYDQEQLQFQSASLGKQLESQYSLGVNEVQGKQRFVLFNVQDVLIPAGEVQLMTVTFKVNANGIGALDSPLELNDVVISDQLGNDISSITLIEMGSFSLSINSDIEISIGDLSGEPGEWIDAPITFTSSGQVMLLQFDVSYDPQVLIFRKAALGEALKNDFVLDSANIDGKERIILYSLNGKMIPEGEIQLGTLTWIVRNEGQSDQKYPLVIKNVMLGDENAAHITAQTLVDNGQFTMDTRFFLEPKQLTLSQNGEKVTVEAFFFPTSPIDEENSIVTWQSSNPEVAEIVGNGLSAEVSPKAVGQATITAVLEDGSQSEGCKVIVNPQFFEGVTIDSNKQVVTLQFNDQLTNNTVNPELLKQGITFAQNGSDFVSLVEEDIVEIQDHTLIVIFDQTLIGNQNRIKIQANTLGFDSESIIDQDVITPPIVGVNDECFIATASYGSKFEPAVVLLRNFRDEYLLTNTLGRRFVDFYYHNSPPIANFISNHEILKGVVRGLLVPVIGVVYLIMHPVVTIMIVIGMMAMFGWWQRRRKVIAL